MDVTGRFLAIFCTRLTYYEQCATKNHQEYIHICIALDLDLDLDLDVDLDLDLDLDFDLDLDMDLDLDLDLDLGLGGDRGVLSDLRVRLLRGRLPK